MAICNQLKQLIDIAYAAGDAIMPIYQRDFAISNKADNSPVTEADLAAHQVIVAGLKQMSTLPILSEEAADIDWSERASWGEFWLVDPLDGTKEFINRNGEFTVNIALIVDQQPVMAVVYAPALGKLYCANQQGAWRIVDGQTQPLQVQQVSAQSLPVVRVVGSRSHPSPDLADYLNRFELVDMVPVGSSLKFCIVAEGGADCYPRLGPTMWWDTAAGHCVAVAAGANVSQFDGTALRYNHQESMLNPYFLVTRLSAG